MDQDSNEKIQCLEESLKIVVTLLMSTIVTLSLERKVLLVSSPSLRKY